MSKYDDDVQGVLSKQDGSSAMKHAALFVGGRFDGMIVSHGELEKMGNGNFSVRWSQCKYHNPITVNPNLEDQPKVDGYIGPMWDGGMLRYETQEVYDLLSM